MPALQPNYLTTDALGRVGANFSGHIEAAGVDLLAGDNNSPPADRKVRWLRQSDGAVVADILAYGDGTGNRAASLDAYGLPTKRTTAAITSIQDGGNSAALNAFTDDAADIRRAGGSVGSQGFTILEEDGTSFNYKSSFVQAINLTPQTLAVQWDAGAGLIRFYVNGINVKSV